MSDIGNIRLDFQVYDTKDPFSLLVADFSEWKVLKGIPAYIEITMPGSRKPITLPYLKNGTQGYNSNTLGLTCPEPCKEGLAPLPDGIYKFCLRGGKDGERRKERFFLKRDIFWEKISKEWIDLGLQFNPLNRDKAKVLFEVEAYLRAAESNVIKGNIPIGKEIFELAKDKLSTVVGCVNCY